MMNKIDFKGTIAIKVSFYLNYNTLYLLFYVLIIYYGCLQNLKAVSTSDVDTVNCLITYMSRISGAFIFCLLKKWIHLLSILRSL